MYCRTHTRNINFKSNQSIKYRVEKIELTDFMQLDNKRPHVVIMTVTLLLDQKKGIVTETDKHTYGSPKNFLKQILE